MKVSTPLIFVIEDDFLMSEMISHELAEQGYKHVMTFITGEAALDNLYKMPDIVICDFHLVGEINGEDVLKDIKAFNPDIQVVMLSGQEKMEVAINSLKFGAYDYVVKDGNAVSKVGILVKRIDEFNIKLTAKTAKNCQKPIFLPQICPDWARCPEIGHILCT